MRRFWRGLVIFLVGGMLGTGFGVALGFFFFPFVFPPPTAIEQLIDLDRSPLAATGTFIHANPSDPVHWGRGKVSVYERGILGKRLRGRAGTGLPRPPRAEGEYPQLG